MTEVNEKTGKSGGIRVYVCESDPHEMKIARAWVQKNDPKALIEGRLVDKVRLPKLAPNHILVPLVREENCSPAQYTEYDQKSGRRMAVRETPIARLVEEMKLRMEVPVENHWIAGQTGGLADVFNNSFSGDVSSDSLFSALALVCQPCTPRIEIGEPEIMRLRRI